MGRPKIDIDESQVMTFAEEGASNREIADYFGCDEGTIRRRFPDELRMGRALRKMKLRRKQTDMALDGNATMLVWLGKNELGQSDKQAIEHSGPDGGPIQVGAVDLTKLSVDDLRHLRELRQKATVRVSEN